MRTVSDIEKHRQAKQREILLAIIDEFREQIANDEITEFVISSITADEDVEVLVATPDQYSAVGILATAQHQLISSVTRYHDNKFDDDIDPDLDDYDDSDDPDDYDD